jgi:hypothetical protein
VVRKPRAERDFEPMTTEETNTAATVAKQGAHGAPERAPSKKGASQKKGAPKGRKPAKSKAKASPPKKNAKADKKPAKARRAKATAPRSESKGARILELIARAKGATLADLMKVPTGRVTALGAISPPSPRNTGLRSSPQRTKVESAHLQELSSDNRS